MELDKAATPRVVILWNRASWAFHVGLWESLSALHAAREIEKRRAARSVSTEGSEDG